MPPASLLPRSSLLSGGCLGLVSEALCGNVPELARIGKTAEKYLGHPAREGA